MSNCKSCNGTVTPIEDTPVYAGVNPVQSQGYVKSGSAGVATATRIPTPTVYSGTVIQGGAKVSTELPIVTEVDDDQLADISNVENVETCPTETQQCCVDNTEITCPSPNQKIAVPTQAYHVPLDWLKSKPVTSMRLLGMDKQKMARLIGAGFLRQDNNGNVELVENPPLKATKLFHSLNRSNINEKTLLGDPMPVEHDVVADNLGNLYLQRGLSDQQSIKVWNPTTLRHEHIPLTQLETCVGKQLPESSRLELVGIDPLLPTDPVDKERCLQRFIGEGILVAKKQETTQTQLCECEDCGVQQQVATETTVFEFLPNPVYTGTECWVIAYGANGHEWMDVAVNEKFRGPQGIQGLKGETGNEGPMGEVGLRGGTNCEVTCDDNIGTGGILSFASDPASGTPVVYYNTTTNVTRQWNGTSYENIDNSTVTNQSGIPQYPDEPDPTIDPVYYDTTTNCLRQYKGSSWENVPSPSDIPVVPDNIVIYSDTQPADPVVNPVYFDTTEGRLKEAISPSDYVVATVVESLTADPVDGELGIYFNTTTNKMRQWNPNTMMWEDVDSTPATSTGIDELPSDPIGPSPGAYYNTTTNTIRAWDGTGYVDVESVIDTIGIVQSSTDPVDSGATAAYYNTVTNEIKYWDGTSYVSIVDTDTIGIHQLAADPVDFGTTGIAVYYNTTTNETREWDGFGYVAIDTDTDTIGVPQLAVDPAPFGTSGIPVYYNTTENTTKQWNGIAYESVNLNNTGLTMTVLTSDPVGPTPEVYYNSVTKIIRQWDGIQYADVCCEIPTPPPTATLP